MFLVLRFRYLLLLYLEVSIMRKTHDSTRKELYFLFVFVISASAVIGLILGSISLSRTNSITNGTDGEDGVDGTDSNYTETTEEIAWTGGWNDTENRTIAIVTLNNIVSIWFTEVI